MRYIKDSKEQLEVFPRTGLRSPDRDSETPYGERPDEHERPGPAMGLTAGALTSHVRKLEETDLIRINSDNTGHGNQKICEPHLEKILFVFSSAALSQNEYRSHLRVGQYFRLPDLPHLRHLHRSAIHRGEWMTPVFYTSETL